MDLFTSGQIAANQGNCKVAIQYFEAMLKKDPRHVSAMEHISECQINLGDLTGAIDTLRKIIQIDTSPRNQARLDLLQGKVPKNPSQNSK